MTTFDKREEAFEKKFALDEELKFKAEVRRNRLLGLWAAEHIGLTGEAATAYAKDVVTASFEQTGDGDVIHKISADLAAANRAGKGATVSEPQLRAKMEELLLQAIVEVKTAS